jgi:O-antigen/teichoic acid export membrane protein
LLTRHTRFTLAIGLAGGTAAALVLYVLSDALLGLLFGAGYPERAGPILRVLIVAACPLVIIDHYVALCRVEGRTLAASRLVIPGSIAQIAIAALGARVGGLSDLSLGWVIGVSLEAALMLPLVYGVVAPRRAHT